MQCLLVYDIPDDRQRTRIADACLDYGLDRIQYSAFSGCLLPTHQEELMLKIQKILGRKAGNVQLFPLCAEDWAKRKTIAQGPAVG
jgi:CRISPR-associated protein Cas2